MSGTWIVLQYDDRPINKLYKKLKERNELYCDMHDYKYIFKTEGYENYPPYWIKVFLTNDLLKEYKDCKGILWLDTDAVIYDVNKSIDQIITEDKEFCLAGDNIICDDIAPFNAGVWIVKNNEIGRTIINEWMNNYNNLNWTKKNSTWTCITNWAGVDYEQGAFVEYIMPKFNEHIQSLEWYVFQSTDPLYSNNLFTLHFFGKNTRDLIKFVKDMC